MPLPDRHAPPVAYSSLGHMGLLMRHLRPPHHSACRGPIARFLAHGLITSLLFCLVGMIEDPHRHHRIPSHTSSTISPFYLVLSFD